MSVCIQDASVECCTVLHSASKVTVSWVVLYNRCAFFVSIFCSMLFPAMVTPGRPSKPKQVCVSCDCVTLCCVVLCCMRAVLQACALFSIWI
jgi:hypothetical protein